jgi:hypothetical protein
MHDGNPEKMMKIPEIGHGELRVQALGEATKKRGR